RHWNFRRHGRKDSPDNRCTGDGFPTLDGVVPGSKRPLFAACLDRRFTIWHLCSIFRDPGLLSRESCEVLECAAHLPRAVFAFDSHASTRAGVSLDPVVPISSTDTSLFAVSGSAKGPAAAKSSLGINWRNHGGRDHERRSLLFCRKGL